jgi:hypothetical protein
LDGGLVADGELVEPACDGAVALEPADGPFDGVALLVGLGLKGWGPPAAAALGDPGPAVVFLLGK